MQVILPHVFPREVIGSLAKIAGEVFNDSQVTSDCRWRVVTTLEFFQHPLSKIGHVSLLIEAHTLQAAIFVGSAHAQRPPHQRLRSSRPAFTNRCGLSVDVYRDLGKVTGTANSAISPENRK